MIHLNLIDAAERLASVETVAPVRVTRSVRTGQYRKKFATFMVAAGFVLVGFSCFLSVCGVPGPLQGLFPAAYLNLIDAKDPTLDDHRESKGQRTSAGGTLQVQAANAAAMARQHEAMSIKQLVGEINPQALYNKKRTDYSSYLPLEKMSYQKASLGQFFAFLNAATPDDVGFSDCIYDAPNFFYIRGVAAKPVSQRSFLERVKSVSTEFKTPPLPENAPATDITAWGLFTVSNAKLDAVSTFVSTADVANEVKSLKNLAATSKVNLSGLDKPVVEDFGVYKRYSYRVTTSADFSDLQAFVTAFATSPLRFGVRQVEMKQAKKDLSTAIRLDMFVVP